eukprot:jgi/Psemu1/43116/gm1.43116_g
MRYLHQQSLPIFQNLASVMFNNGTYSFLPEEWVPAAAPTLAAAPNPLAALSDSSWGISHPRGLASKALPGPVSIPLPPLEDQPPNTTAKHDDDQWKHRMSVENNLKAALRNESYATDEFLRNLSLEVTTCFTALMTKVYLVSSIIESEPRPDFRKTTSTTSRSDKKGKGKKKKSDTTLSNLGPIPRQIDVMVNLFLSEVDNSVTGVLELMTRKQISDRFKDYDLNNKWLNFKSLLGNVEDKIGGASLYGRNVVNYATIKKYMLFYREILVWYMNNVQYPPGPDNTPDGLFFHTKFQNGSPHDSKQYALRKLWVDFQRQSKRIFTTLSLCHLDIKLLTHKDFYQYFLQELFQNSFVLGTTVLSGEKWVPVGFHQQGDTNVLKTGQVILPLHSSLVFHNYNIHFEFNDDHVTLSPCKLGTGKIRLAPFIDTKGIIYLVNEWLIRKVVDPCKNLGANVVRSLEPAFFNANDNGCFDYDHVMETIEDLVLTERKFLAGAMIPKLSDKNVAYFQRMDRLYIYPMAGVLSTTQFAHVNFEDTPEQLVTGILELLGLDDNHDNETCVTRFLQYDVNSQQEVHQQIFMEHIPYVFHKIFVIDPEGVERYTWVEELILYSYLPEMGTIFTPLTEKLAGYLLEKSDDLLSANILVEFLDDNVVNNYGKGTGELNPAFKHLQGCDFAFHKLSDFETWDCFKTTISDIQNGFIPPWVVEDRSQNNINHPHTGTNEEHGSTDTGNSSTEKAKLSQPSGIDKPKGNSDNAGNGDNKMWEEITNMDRRIPKIKSAKVSNVSSTDEGSERNEQDDINKSEEVAPHWAIPLIRCQVTLTKFALRTEGTTYSYVYARRNLNVLLKEKDPEIMYPIYKINEQICHADDGQFPVPIGEVSGYSFQEFMNYDACPGYDILFNKGKVDQVCHWYPHFCVSPTNTRAASLERRGRRLEPRWWLHQDTRSSKQAREKKLDDSYERVAQVGIS